jgi:hypothetical protein
VISENRDARNAIMMPFQSVTATIESGFQQSVDSCKSREVFEYAYDPAATGGDPTKKADGEMRANLVIEPCGEWTNLD